MTEEDRERYCALGAVYTIMMSDEQKLLSSNRKRLLLSWRINSFREQLAMKICPWLSPWH